MYLAILSPLIIFHCRLKHWLQNEVILPGSKIAFVWDGFLMTLILVVSWLYSFQVRQYYSGISDLKLLFIHKK